MTYPKWHVRQEAPQGRALWLLQPLGASERIHPVLCRAPESSRGSSVCSELTLQSNCVLPGCIAEDVNSARSSFWILARGRRAGHVCGSSAFRRCAAVGNVAVARSPSTGALWAPPGSKGGSCWSLWDRSSTARTIPGAEGIFSLVASVNQHPCFHFFSSF